jgi:hypothetical protein
MSMGDGENDKEAESAEPTSAPAPQVDSPRYGPKRLIVDVCLMLAALLIWALFFKSTSDHAYAKGRACDDLGSTDGFPEFLMTGVVWLGILIGLVVHACICGMRPRWMAAVRCGMVLVVIAAPFSPVLRLAKPGASRYLDGFCDGKKQSDLDQVQEWAKSALDRHAQGKLSLLQDGQLSPGDIPSTVTEIWGKPPYRVAVERVPGDEQPGILISWYLHGMVVGPPNFRTHFAAWEVRQVQPGIYVFMREK